MKTMSTLISMTYSNLTLTSVVFEYFIGNLLCVFNQHLTLTSVVFEFVWHVINRKYANLTLTSVVFESQLLTT